MISVCGMLTFAFGLGQGNASRKRVAWNTCTGKSYALQQFLYEYNLHLGNITAGTDLIPQVVTAVSMGAQLAELLCYLVMFHHIYQHNKYMLTRNALTAEEVSNRHHKNAVTFLGQFYAFMVEIVSFALMLYCVSVKNSTVMLRAFTVTIIWVEFGISSVVEVYTSSNLKRYLPHYQYML